MRKQKHKEKRPGRKSTAPLNPPVAVWRSMSRPTQATIFHALHYGNRPWPPGQAIYTFQVDVNISSISLLLVHNPCIA